MIQPSVEEFERLSAEYPVVPVELRVLADTQTPIALYQGIRHRSRYSFLLESVQGSEGRARYSFVGFAPREILGSREGQPFLSRDGTPARDPQDPLQYLRELGAAGVCPIIPGLPSFAGGSVGYVAYDAVGRFGDVTLKPRTPSGIPEIFFMTFDRVICFDHLKNTLSFIVNVPTRDRSLTPAAQYKRALAELEDLYASLAAPPRLGRLSIPVATKQVPLPANSTFDRANFILAVERVKEYIRAGDVFQCVLSQRYSVPIGSTDPLDIYRVLRFLNPSPYMYCLNFGSFQVVGTSPEALIRLSGDTVSVRPIAGTRRRGTTPEEDQKLETELKEDPKEQAEHIMLVDLGRNDVGRVSQYGTVSVSELMHVEHYSHVMHLVSNVEGKRKPGLDPVDIFAAGFPAGTVTGAPKIRAMQVIDELEPEARGLYAGGIGYFSFSGQMDSCIAIRTMVIQDGVAHIQGGAGIVADSDPELEYQETINKAKALLQSISFLQGESKRDT